MSIQAKRLNIYREWLLNENDSNSLHCKWTTWTEFAWKYTDWCIRWLRINLTGFQEENFTCVTNLNYDFFLLSLRTSSINEKSERQKIITAPETMNSIFLSGFIEKLSNIKQNMLLIFMTLALLRDKTRGFNVPTRVLKKCQRNLKAWTWRFQVRPLSNPLLSSLLMGSCLWRAPLR